MNIRFDVGIQNSKLEMRVSQTKTGAEQKLLWTMKFYEQYVTVWWSSAGLIHHSFIKQGETTTAKKYCREIDEMHQIPTCEQLPLVNRKDPILLHVVTTPHFQ